VLRLAICYEIIELKTEQSGLEDSFIGGKPKLPINRGVPKCKLCEKEQTFYMQVAFPNNHFFEGLSMALFSCTSCVDSRYLIPEMLDLSLKEVIVPKSFLDEYQRNFKIMIVNTKECELLTDYQEKVLFKRIDFREIKASLNKNKIGGEPNWIQTDESPRNYHGEIDFFFLMQLVEGYKFEILKDAEGQFEYNIFGKAVESDKGYYELFLGNHIYFFATGARDDPKVYIITQVD
jgi:hypothetical protein